MWKTSRLAATFRSDFRRFAADRFPARLVFSQFDEYPARRPGVQECNASSIGPGSRDIVNECHTGRTTLREGRVEVVDREAHMVDSRTALLDEARDWGIGMLGFQQFDEGITGCQATDPRAVTVAEGDLWETEHVAKERQGIAQGSNGEAEVGDAGGAGLVGS